MNNTEAKNWLFAIYAAYFFMIASIIMAVYYIRVDISSLAGYLSLIFVFSFECIAISFVFVSMFVVCLFFSVSVGVSSRHEIHRVVIISGGVISVFFQFTFIMVTHAWTWSPVALAGTFFLIQFWCGYLMGWVQRDIAEGRVKSHILYIVAELWVLIPLIGFGWLLSWGCYMGLFIS